MIGTFTKNAIITLLTQGLIFCVGLIISVLLARILGPENRGVYTLAIILPSFLLYFTCFGIGQSSVYYLGENKYSPKDIFGNNFILSILVSILAILIGLAIIFSIHDILFPGVDTIYLLFSIFLAPGLIFFSFIASVLLGIQKIKKYNLIYLLNKILLLSAMLGIYLLGIEFNVIMIMVTEIAVIYISCIVLFFMTLKEANGISLKLNKRYFRDSFQYGFKIYIGSVIFFIYNKIGILLINYFLNPLMVGFYSIGVGLSERLCLVSDSVATVLFPKISSEKDKLKIKDFTPVVFRNIILIIAFVCVTLYAIAYWLILFLYSEAFLASVGPFQILLIGVIATSGNKILESDIRGRGRPMLVVRIITISAVTNILLYVILIPMLGITGAALATSASSIVNLILLLTAYCKLSGNSIATVLIIKKSDFMLYRNIFIVLNNKFMAKR